MSDDFSERLTHHPPTSAWPRLRRSMFGQARVNPVCPSTRVDGAVALVTGGSRGIGLETSRGLASRGAEVITASRGEDSGKEATQTLAAAFDVPAHFLSLDLGDLASVRSSAGWLEDLLEGRRLDILVANAGLWPTRFAQSKQGHEIAFATNVLGHHALLRNLLERDLLAPGARIVVLTGDIYILSSECSSDYRYRGRYGGQLAYCRSKLGNLWLARELARRAPSLRVHAVHPGVIASELSGSASGLVGALKRSMLLSAEQGAQTSLFCATQPGLESGTYYHNTMGRVELAPDDPAADAPRARALWERLDALSASFVSATSRPVHA